MIWTQKTAYQVVIRLYLSLLKDKSAIQMSVKKDIKAEKQVLVLLFWKLKEFVKKKKVGDTLLSVMVGWPAIQLCCSAFCKT